jgi:HEAT repeat protein
MRLLAFLLASLLLLGSPAWGQAQLGPLIEALSDEDEESMVRERAAWLLGKLGPRAAKAVPALIEALSDDNYYLRLCAAEALAEIGPKAAPAVSVLTEMLTASDDGHDARWLAATALAAIGSAAEPAIPALVAALSNKDGEVRSSVRGSGRRSVDVRWSATGALTRIGAPAIAALIGTRCSPTAARSRSSATPRATRRAG